MCNIMPTKNIFSNLLGLQFFFQTFSYQVNVLTQDTYLDILCKATGSFVTKIGPVISPYLQPR